MASTTTTSGTRSLADLTQAYFGEALTMDEVFARVELIKPAVAIEAGNPESLWVGSVGYERHKDHRAFAQHLSNMGVERLVDVRDLPISRRRGYAKKALDEAMAEVGIEYLHVKALGNPKPYRDMYKSGRVEEGRRCYEQLLLTQRRDALLDLVPLLSEKRSALMCVEHDPETCHRTVIVDALRDAHREVAADGSQRACHGVRVATHHAFHDRVAAFPFQPVYARAQAVGRPRQHHLPRSQPLHGGVRVSRRVIGHDHA
jgi:hypothetical protein